MDCIFIRILRLNVFCLFVFLTVDCYSQGSTIVFENSSKEYSILIDTSDYLSENYFDAESTNLMIAASKGYLTEIERLLKKGANINAQTMEGATPLIFAITNNQTEAVKVLLRHNPLLNEYTQSYETPLLIAVKSNNLPIAELLIRSDADIDFPDANGATPLHYAAIYGYLDIVDMLIYYNANINEKTDEDLTPLSAAIWAGNSEIADLLLQNGANSSETDNEGDTPFLMAAFSGDTISMDLLIKKGVDIYLRNNQKFDALNIAIATHHLDAVRFLLRRGDNWKTPGTSALNPYDVCTSYGNRKAIVLLKENKVPGKVSYGFNSAQFSISGKYSNDFFTGISLSLKEPLLNAGLIFGCDMKLWYTKVTKKTDERIFYQYFDKSSMAYAGVFKDFSLTNNPFKTNYALSASLVAGYSFGNKLKGTRIFEPEHLSIIPNLSFKVLFSDFTCFAGFEYLGTNYYHSGPVWFRAGCTYSYSFSNIKIKKKIINLN
jgi:ankyrin repeat protein